MANIGRILSKAGSGFLGGFASGGWYGGLTGGATAAMTGGKNKPLKSMALGAGSGFLGGYAAQKLGYQSGVTNVGPYSFRPLSSRFINYTSNMFSGPKPPAGANPGSPAPGTPYSSGPMLTPPIQAGGTYGGLPFPIVTAGEGGYPAQAPAERGGTDWLPIAAAVGGALFLTGSV